MSDRPHEPASVRHPAVPGEGSSGPMTLGVALLFVAALGACGPLVGAVTAVDGSAIGASLGAGWVAILPALLVLAFARSRRAPALAVATGAGLFAVVRLVTDLPLVLGPDDLARPELFFETSASARPFGVGTGSWLVLLADVAAVAVGVVAARALAAVPMADRAVPGGDRSDAAPTGRTGAGARGRTGAFGPDEADGPAARFGAGADLPPLRLAGNAPMIAVGCLGTVLVAAGLLSVPYRGGYLELRLVPAAADLSGVLAAFLALLTLAVTVLVAAGLPRPVSAGLLAGAGLAAMLPGLTAVAATATGAPTGLAAAAFLPIAGGALIAASALLNRLQSVVDGAGARGSDLDGDLAPDIEPPVGTAGAAAGADIAGPQGAAGPAGTVGTSGVVGAGIAGPPGAAGPAGPAGTSGAVGAGIAVPQGAAGPAGTAGTTGAVGADTARRPGAAGPAGTAGTSGAAGADAEVRTSDERTLSRGSLIVGLLLLAGAGACLLAWRWPILLFDGSAPTPEVAAVAAPAAPPFLPAAIVLAVTGVLALLPATAQAARTAAGIVWAGAVLALTDAGVILSRLTRAAGNTQDPLSPLMAAVPAEFKHTWSAGPGLWAGVIGMTLAAVAAVLAPVVTRRVAERSLRRVDDESADRSRAARRGPILVLVLLVAAAGVPPVWSADLTRSASLLRGYEVGTLGVWAVTLTAIGAVIVAGVTLRPAAAVAAPVAAAVILAQRCLVSPAIRDQPGFRLDAGFITGVVAVVALLLAAPLCWRLARRVRTVGSDLRDSGLRSDSDTHTDPDSNADPDGHGHGNTDTVADSGPASAGRPGDRTPVPPAGHPAGRTVPGT